ncbi:MAG: TMEM43 family protein [Rhizonema sp. NSF051]|nr:TMEM43 family protein [Rhizonema sp. NSF051]
MPGFNDEDDDIDEYTDEDDDIDKYTNQDDDIDEYTEVREFDWFTRIGESVKAIGIGFLAILVSFFVLILNEGQLVVKQVAQQAIPISSTVVNNQYIGKLVSTSGVITSSETLGDHLFIKPGKYIALGRRVEMYAWVEKRNKQVKTKLGGSQTQKITAIYEKRWLLVEHLNEETMSLARNDTSIIESTKSTSFLQPQNHQNPSVTIENAGYKVNAAKIGIFDLDMQSFQLPSGASVAQAFDAMLTVPDEEIPTPTVLQLSNNNTLPGAKITSEYNYLYKGSGTLTTPNIGDLRMRYATLNTNTNVTIIGMLGSNHSIVPYVHKNNQRFYRIFTGTQSQALERIKKEEHWTWGVRFLALIIMWYGFRVLAEPINIVLDFIPIFGSIGRLTTGFSTLIISLTLTIATIIIYHLTSNLLYIVIAIPISFIIVGILFRKR